MVCLKLRRVLKTYFGNYKNFIAWCAAVGMAIYTIDTLITPAVVNPKMRRIKEVAEDLSTRSIAADVDDDRPLLEGLPPEENPPMPPPRKEIIHAMHCGLAAECPRGKYSYFIRSGYGRDISAIMCFNENYIVAEDKVVGDRGMNIVVINDATLNVEEIKVFDVYSTDESLISYIKNGIKDNHLILVASQDEASFNLSSAARREFYKYGSSILDQVNFRDNYVIIGQKGIPKGQAIEAGASSRKLLRVPLDYSTAEKNGFKLEARKQELQFAESAVVSGCLSIPVANSKGAAEKKPAPAENKPVPAENKPVPIEPVKSEKKSAEKVVAPPVKAPAPAAKEEKKLVAGDAKAFLDGKIDNANSKKKSDSEKGKSELKVGEELANCGVTSPCTDDAFPVHLFTGVQAKEFPKICINGKYVMSKGLNDAGRGLNFAVVNPKTKDVIRLARFDTYGTDDNAIELFLEMLDEGDIVLGVAHDEASNKLDKSVREMIEGLGSSHIHRLSFRDVWAFVGQKGINGFSPIEWFEFSDANSERQVLLWPNSIDKRICVPSKLKALPQRKILVRNEARKSFCKKHDGYGVFCNKDNIDNPIAPTELKDKSLANDPIFSIPIAVISGLEYNSLRRQLENLFANPGIRADKIMVFYDEKFEEAGELATVFNVSSQKLDSSIKYTELMDKAISATWKLFPKTKHAIILEEELFPSTDFLNFFRQCLPAVEADSTLAGISAWNDNAYDGRAGLKSVAYRAELLPGLGFLLKKSFYEDQIKSRMAECCMRRSWEGWITDDMTDFEMVIPDVSRMERGQYNGRMTDLLKELFRRPRVSTGFGGSQNRLTNADSLVTEKYEAYLEQMIRAAGAVNETELQMCLSDPSHVFNISILVKGSYAVYYEQESLIDEKLLSLLCKCFKIFHVPGYNVRNTHRGLVQFSHGAHMVFLIGSMTDYYSFKPSDVEPLMPREAKAA